jgi:hypothetical protein
MAALKNQNMKRARLSVREDKQWVHYFCYYLNEDKTDSQADKLAWRDMLLEFPRLRKFQGCLP